MSYTLSLTPSDVTVGERAQLVYRFTSEEPFPLQKFSLTEKDGLIIKANEAGFYSIYSLQFESDGSEYAMVIDFIPWKAGELVFAPFDFSSLAGNSSEVAGAVAETAGENLAAEADAQSEIEAETQTQDYIIQIPPVLIRSVTKETGISTLQPPSPPLVIPGTTYTVYLSVLVCALLVTLATFVLLRFRQIRALCRNVWLNTKRRRNAHKFLRLLKSFAAAKKSFSDDVFSAEKISKEIRVYLERRFALPFESAVTGEIVNVADGLFKPCCIESLAVVQKVLARCDELRFSGEDARKVFADGERSSLAAQLKEAVLHFEKYHEPEQAEGAELDADSEPMPSQGE